MQFAVAVTLARPSVTGDSSRGREARRRARRRSAENHGDAFHRVCRVLVDYLHSQRLGERRRH